MCRCYSCYHFKVREANKRTVKEILAQVGYHSKCIMNNIKKYGSIRVFYCKYLFAPRTVHIGHIHQGREDLRSIEKLDVKCKWYNKELPQLDIDG